MLLFRNSGVALLKFLIDFANGVDIQLLFHQNTKCILRIFNDD